jgi:prepilin signal peptidase PulO-like enzyme (type II secretory pathway)
MALLIAFLGLAIGSFLNVVIGRLRSGETAWRSRSRCPDCHAVLRPSELVPLLSFVILRGRCRSCQKPISWQYPGVEFSTMALFLASYFVHGAATGLLSGGAVLMARDFVFIAGLTVVFVVDLLDRVVFDSVTIPMIVIAFAFNLAVGAVWWNLLLAAAVGGGFFLLQFVVSKGRWIGGGDIRIGAMMGMMLGFPGVLLALFLAYVVGALAAVALLAMGKAKWSSQMAFGTFLTAATMIVLFFGQPMLAWYASLLAA